MACCGGQKPADLNDENTINVFKQAVQSHNTAANDTLEYTEIVSATMQVVSGFMFRGVIKCTKGGAVSEYEVDVWQKPGGQEIDLQKFEAK